MPEFVYSEHNSLAKTPDLLNSFLDLENYFLLNHQGILEGVWSSHEKCPAPISA